MAAEAELGQRREAPQPVPGRPARHGTARRQRYSTAEGGGAVHFSSLGLKFHLNFAEFQIQQISRGNHLFGKNDELVARTATEWKCLGNPPSHIAHAAQRCRGFKLGPARPSCSRLLPNVMLLKKRCSSAPPAAVPAGASWAPAWSCACNWTCSCACRGLSSGLGAAGAGALRGCFPLLVLLPGAGLARPDFFLNTPPRDAFWCLPVTAAGGGGGPGCLWPKQMPFENGHTWGPGNSGGSCPPVYS